MTSESGGGQLQLTCPFPQLSQYRCNMTLREWRGRYIKSRAKDAASCGGGL